jgi:Domain of unknown function (DUF4157)
MLAVGRVDDPLEHEADRVADQAMGSSAARPPVSRNRGAGGQATVQAKRSAAPQGGAHDGPSAVLAAFGSPGRPLDASARAFFEPRFGVDFSDIRIHSDDKAAAAADAVSARAFTRDKDLYFGKSEYRPATPQGRRLIAHELTHAVQNQSAAGGQGDVVSIRRDAKDPIPSAGLTLDPTRTRLSDADKLKIDSWLRSHQVVLMRDKHKGWLDGQSLDIASIIARLRREARIMLPDDDVIAAYVDSRFLNPPRSPLSGAGGLGAGPPQSGLGQPHKLQLGGGQTPGLLSGGPQLGQPSPNAPQLKAQLLPADQFKIDGYLIQHKFDLDGLNPTLDGKPVTADEIVDLVKPLVFQFVGREEIRAYIGAKIAGMIVESIKHPKPGKPPTIPPDFFFKIPDPPSKEAGKPPGRAQGWQTVLSAGAQIAWHVNVVTGKPASTPEDVTMQFQAGRNFAAHADKESGSELQGMVQFGYNITTRQATILEGGQYTEVISLFNGLLQVGGFVQVLAGVAVSNGSISGQIQPSAGLQALVQVGPLQFGVQGSSGATITPGGESTLDRSAATVFQVQF